MEVTYSLHFDKLNPISPVNPLKTTFFICLPQETHQLLNGNNVQYFITTYCGHDNILGMTLNHFCMDIMTPTNQDRPFLLKPPRFQSQVAQTDYVAICNKIKEKILFKAKDSILDLIYQALCPTFQLNPHAMISSLKQVYNMMVTACPSLSWCISIICALIIFLSWTNTHYFQHSFCFNFFNKVYIRLNISVIYNTPYSYKPNKECIFTHYFYQI